MPTNSTRTRVDDQRKDHIDPKVRKQRNRPQHLQTHNLTTNDVENINSTNKGIDLLLFNKQRSLSNRKDAAKEPEAQHNNFT